MTNNQFWESYKKKCDEKGIAPLYENAEEFAKAMTEPPKPYSTDDFTPKRDIDEEESIDDIDVGNMKDLEQVTTDAKKREEEQNVKNVEWKRCEHCGEMKEEMYFRRYRNGEHGKVCNTCIGSKISAGHKKSAKTIEEHEPTPDKGERLKTLTPFLDEKKIAVPESTLPKLPDRHCDAADAIALGLALHVEEKVPLLKEQPVIKAISDETLRSMIVMAYKRGFDEGKMNAIEPIKHDDAMAFVEHYLRGCEHE